MSDYFSHPNLSNSDIKAFLKQMGKAPFDDPANLQAIFDFGSFFHAVILEPHKTHAIKAESEHLTEEDIQLAHRMADTFWADTTCRHFASANDFHREYPFTPHDNMRVGPYKTKLRCKVDGVRLRTGSMLELKGLNLDTEKAFREALVRYDYDQAIAHYMITGDFRIALIVGISKKDPRKLFKWWVKRHDDFYAMGEQKLIEDLELIQQYAPEDVVL